MSAAAWDASPEFEPSPPSPVTPEAHLLPASFVFLAALPEPAVVVRLADIDVGRGRLRLRGIHNTLLDVSGQAVKGLVDVDVALGRDLEEWDVQLAGQSLSLFGRHNTLLLPITLVAD